MQAFPSPLPLHFERRVKPSCKLQKKSREGQCLSAFQYRGSVWVPIIFWVVFFANPGQPFLWLAHLWEGNGSSDLNFLIFYSPYYKWQ